MLPFVQCCIRKRFLLAVILIALWLLIIILQNNDENTQQEGCLGNEETLEDLSQQQLRNIYVIEKYRALYCKVPKVGCTTWKRVLLVLAGVAKDTTVNGELVHNELGKKYLKTLNQYSPEERKRLVANYFKFAFVRHPLDRMDSAYRDKIVGTYNKDKFFMLNFGRKMIRKYRKNPSNESLHWAHDVTLTEFARYVADTPDKDNNEHWQSQTLLCAPCAIKYDFIGRFENFEDDVAKVLERIGSPYITLPKKGPKHLLWNESFQSVPQQFVANLSRKFLSDYKIFGYDFDATLNIGATKTTLNV